MHMVGHNHKRTQINIFCVIFKFVPQNIGNNSNSLKFHVSISYFTETGFTVLAANGNKIGPFRTVIPFCNLVEPIRYRSMNLSI